MWPYLGNLEVIGFLLDKRADINLQDNRGSTALHRASYSSMSRLDEEMITLLLARSADANVRDESGYTPLSLLMMCGNYTRYSEDKDDEIVQAKKRLFARFQDAGANLDLRDNDDLGLLPLVCYGRTPDHPLVLLVLDKVSSFVEKFHDEVFQALVRSSDQLEAINYLEKWKSSVPERDKLVHLALSAPFAKGHEQHEPPRPMVSDIVLTYIFEFEPRPGYGEGIDLRKGSELLVRAAEKPLCFGVTKFLLDWSADPNDHRAESLSPLQILAVHPFVCYLPVRVYRYAVPGCLPVNYRTGNRCHLCEIFHL